MFPRKELKRSGKSFAIIASESGNLKIIKIKPEKGRTFYYPEFGIFRTIDKYRYIFGRSEIFFYSPKNMNPVDIGAIADIKDALAKNYKKSLNMEEVKMIAEGTDALTSRAITFLDDYYEEDIVATMNMISIAQHKNNFRLKTSISQIPFIPQNTYNMKNLAIVVIDNIRLDIVQADIRIDYKENKRYIRCKYGEFEIKDTRTRYRYKKTAVYIVSVTSKAEQIQEEQSFKAIDQNENKKEGENENENKNKNKNSVIKKSKIKKQKDDIIYTPDPNYTISINTSSILPVVNYLEPLLMYNTVKTTWQLKARRDEVSKPTKKSGLSPAMVLVIGFVFAIAVAIIYSQVLKPEWDAQRVQQIKLKQIEKGVIITQQINRTLMPNGTVIISNTTLPPQTQDKKEVIENNPTDSNPLNMINPFR